MDRIAEIRTKKGLDDYFICHTLEEFHNLPVHPVRKLTITEELEALNEDDIHGVREIIKRISEVKSEVEKASYVKKLHEITGISTRSIQKDIQSYVRHNSSEENSRDSNSPYEVNEDGSLYLLKQINDGLISVKLANFTARITEEIVEDNGVDILHTYMLEGASNRSTLPKIVVAANLFPTLTWLSKWGSGIILEPGQSIKDSVRHAIQVMSTGTKKSVCFTYTGWREINGEMVYLTSSGAIGAKNVQVKLSHELQRYCLPLIPEQETEAIQMSLSFLELGKREITLPLLCVLYLSVLTTILDPMPNFSAYIYGGTGVFKTALSVLLLQHFGDSWNASLLPNFSDTANSLEKRSFLLKDTLLVLDDYHPDNRKSDAQQKEFIAQRLIRSYSNRTGRGRLNTDTTDKGRYEPRGMLLITGEEIVALQSTLARLAVIKLSEGDINQIKLSALQAKAHLLPHAMSSYVLWVRNNIHEIKTLFKAKFPELRAKACTNGIHKKLPEQVAFLQFALDCILSWIVDKGVVANDEAAKLSREGWKVFMELCNEQSQRIKSEDPVEIFFEITRTLMVQSRVRMKNKNNPADTSDKTGFGEFIGYFDDEYYYFLPQALWHTVQKYCNEESIHFPFKKDTFYRMLKEKRILTSRDKQSATIEYIDKESRRVLKIKKGFLDVHTNEIEN